MAEDITKEEIQHLEEDAERGAKKMIKKFRKARKRTKIIIGIILIIILVVVGFIIFSKKETPYQWTEVARGDVIEEVSATGMVESAEEVDLRFKTSGIIESISVKVGDEVKKETYLARLASGEVYSQFLQAQANYNQAKAKLDQLLAGATTEEIRVTEQVVENAKVALEDAQEKAENDLAQDYNSALVYLVDSSSKCNKALADLKDMERTYFYRNNPLENTFREKRGQAKSAFLKAEELIDEALEEPTNEKIDLALSEIKSAAQKVIDALDYAKTGMADASIREDVSSTDRTTIDTDITNVNKAYSNINTAQANIANQKITNQVNINDAESTFKKAEADLEELKAPPRSVDIAIYQADVEKYRANMTEYNQKLKDASIIAPFAGVVAKIDGKIGEVVSAADKIIISLISPTSFQIRADIPEADIRRLEVNDPVKITLDAFPEETWPGQLVEIEPGETIIEGVVYYRVKILFGETGEKVKSGMSADTIIETGKKENVLHVPYRAIVFKEGRRFVRVLKGEQIEEVEVEIGLRGNEGEVEIISGVSEGERVITFIKK
jgi:HlyD family secretion protein